MALPLKIAIVASAFGDSFGKIIWSQSHFAVQEARRLQVNLAFSEAVNNSDCIVGGFDYENPAEIYVGGPCNQLDLTDVDDPVPMADFRYVRMATVHATLADPDGNEAEASVVGDQFVQAREFSTHAEVGVGLNFKFPDDNDISNARWFMSTTSYLSKADFSYKDNTFVVGCQDDPMPTLPRDCQDYSNVSTCVAPCCDSPPCDCGAIPQDELCPSSVQDMTATQGMFKYSLLSAAHDETDDSSGYVAGSTGNGWARLVEKYGTGTPKVIQGNLEVYQEVDFTYMNADLEVKTNSGSVMYAAMLESDLVSNNAANPTVYSGITEVRVQATGFDATWGFPSTYNLGDWSSSVTGMLTLAVKQTQMVYIDCVKPDAATMVAMGIADNTTVAATTKALLLRYKFNVTGITAAETSGKYIVYDPVVTNGESNNPYVAPAPAPGSTPASSPASMPGNAPAPASTPASSPASMPGNAPAPASTPTNSTLAGGTASEAQQNLPNFVFVTVLMACTYLMFA